MEFDNTLDSKSITSLKIVTTTQIIFHKILKVKGGPTQYTCWSQSWSHSPVSQQHSGLVVTWQ